MINGGFICAVICIAICVVTSAAILLAAVIEKEWLCGLIGSVMLIVSVNGISACNSIGHNTSCVPAEPFAHNQTQTVFTTDEDTYIADGLYPDGTYLLTVDGKDILVVWQAVDGEVG